VETGRDLGICFGDEPLGTFTSRIAARSTGSKVLTADVLS
jgi:hypothetical protein